MSFVTPFVIGGVIGGVAKWQIDRRKQRQNHKLGLQLALAEAQPSQLKAQQAEIDHLREQLVSAEVQLSQLEAQQAEIDHLREQLVSAEVQLSQLQKEVEKDPLEHIKGFFFGNLGC